MHDIIENQGPERKKKGGLSTKKIMPEFIMEMTAPVY
jgi:hypothetical protein